MNNRLGRRLKKSVSICLAAAMLLCPASVFAGSFGDLIIGNSQIIAEDTSLNHNAFWSNNAGGQITENYLEYIPGTVQALASYGHDVYGAASFSRAVALAKEAGHNVIGGINGDFFTMSNGVSIGPVIIDGILRTSENASFESIGFAEDGSAFIGKIGMTISAASVTTGKVVSSAMHYNKALSTSNGIVLFSQDFNTTTEATIPTYNVVLTPEDESFDGIHMNHTYTFTASAAQESAAGFALPEGKLVLAVAKDSPYSSALSTILGIQEGERLEVTATCGSEYDWENAVMAIGGHERLLTNGVNTAAYSITNNSTGSYPLSKNPRTAVGIKSDGSVVLYTVDGRQNGYSAGATLSQLAYRLMEMGCVEAINMDGGGSTTLEAQKFGDSSLTTINSPSEGSLRSCGNYLLLVNTAEPDGEPAHLGLSPYSVWMLSGATQTFSAKATDSGYYAVSVPSDLEYSVTGGIGTVSESGVFTAEAAGDGTIEVQAEESPEISGTAAVKVISSPTTISAKNESTGKEVTSLSLQKGDIVNLTASAVYNRVALVSGDNCFAWEVPAEIGTITADGILTVTAATSVSGNVTVSAGGRSLQIPVTVTKEESPFVDMEGHWAEEYTTYLFNAGIINGSSTPLGQIYNPDNNMTRAEFAVVMSNWLTDELALYSATELPFADLDEIPPWALDAVKAMYSLELITGSSSAETGELYFYPDRSISRQEAMTIIGRTMDIDGTLGELTFTDSADVAAWALPYVKTLISMGAVGGMPDGSLRPNGALTRAQVAKIIACLAE